MLFRALFTCDCMDVCVCVFLFFVGMAVCVLFVFILSGDDLYLQLSKCFVPQGKGRPPAPPKIDAASNRLLLQLILLKQEHDKTGNDVSL